MSLLLSLSGHQTDLGGGLLVHRMLPSARRQTVGPFIFFDHFGPVTQAPDANTDVRPHPHIGLATVTYLFEGAMMHRDSLGSVQRIEPGAINWMTAGRGIVHSERAPDELRGRERRLHGLQLWVALPQSHEEQAPQFAHTAADEIPEVDIDGAAIRVLVGTAWGVTSPVQTPSPTLYVDVVIDAGASIELPAWAEEMALYTVDHALRIDDEDVPVNTMAVLAPTVRVTNPANTPTRFVVIGGAPLDGHRFIWWNFVSSSKERIVQAAQDWEAERLGTVPGETERIPLPAKRPF